MAEASRFILESHKHFNHQRSLPHSCKVGPNLHYCSSPSFDIWDNVKDVLERCPRLSASLPIPRVLPMEVTKGVFSGCDPSLQLVSEKYDYNLEYKRLLKSCNAHSYQGIEQQLVEGNNIQTLVMDSKVASLVELTSQDPDPHFNGDYNFYYGGTLAVSEVQGDKFIIFPQCPSDKVAVIKYKPNDELYDQNEITLFDHHLDVNYPILQINSYSDTLLVRQMKKCGLYRLTDQNIELLNVFHVKDPIITTCFNNFKKGEFATLSPHAVVDIYNVENSLSPEVTIDLKFLQSTDSWGALHYYDENSLMFCNRSSVNLLDLRQPITASGVLNWLIKPVTESCECIYSSAKGSTLEYVCTKHHALSLDTRKGWCQRWTHSLPHSPSLLFVGKQQSDDVLFIGCQTSNVISCVQSTTSTEPIAQVVTTPPFRLPSLDETLHCARSAERCLSHFIDPRFNFSITGFLALENISGFTVFLCNSVGDLFSQKLDMYGELDKSYSSELNFSDFKVLESWETAFMEQLRGKKFKSFATHMKHCDEFHNLYDDQLNPRNGNDVDSNAEGEVVTNQFRFLSKKNLSKCSNPLDLKLLSYWNLDDMIDWNNESEIQDIASESDYYDD